MVGVSRSNGCLSCRKSKIKCDEVKPICERCKKTGRICGYADRFKFIHDKQCGEGDTGDKAATALKRGAFSYTTEKRTKNGGLFQKWHRSVLGQSPSMTSRDIQAYHLIRCWGDGPLGMRFDLMGVWFKKLPARLGKSTALDDAVQLVISVHKRMMFDPNPLRWMCPTSYIKAIRSLRAVLLDPEQRCSLETIIAASILHHIEGKFGRPLDKNTLHHAGGLSQLLHMRGPNRIEDDFEWQIVGHLQGPVISHSMVKETPCFLSELRWIEYIENFEPKSKGGALAQEIMLQFATWPSLLGDVRKLRVGHLSVADLERTQCLIRKLRVRLDDLEIILDEHLTDKRIAALVASTQPDSPFDTVYEFYASSTHSLINIHSAYIFILDRMSDFIDELTCKSTCALIHNRQSSTSAQHQRLVERVCRCFEFTWLRRPLLSGSSALSLVAAYSYAQTEELQRWIIKALNDGDEHRQLEKPRYLPETIEFLNRFYIGAVDLPQASELVEQSIDHDLDIVDSALKKKESSEGFEFICAIGSDVGEK